MMLLPLLDHAIAHGFVHSQSKHSIRVRAMITHSKPRVEIVDSGAGFLPETEDDGIAGIRDRLSALYGDDGTLALQRRGARATEAVLEIPCEHGKAVVAGAS